MFLCTLRFLLRLWDSYKLKFLINNFISEIEHRTFHPKIVRVYPAPEYRGSAQQPIDSGNTLLLQTSQPPERGHNHAHTQALRTLIVHGV